MKINWFNSENYFFTDESVKRQITDSISENFTDSDLESTIVCVQSVSELSKSKLVKGGPLIDFSEFFY